ncbi:MAG TPA: acetate/propionate family kinase [Pirellulales bacterium]|jgi:acetate kinase|nr:acetate/propionate family kinase [Pirellulales bacterium]
MATRVLTINGGSSSIKFAVYALGERPHKELSGEVDRIGLGHSTLSFKISDGTSSRQTIDAADSSRTVEHLIAWLDNRIGLESIAAVGHRIVHGGPKLWQSKLVESETIAELKRISPWDPNHLPAEIALIEAFAERCPRLPQVACFDTAFHRDLPRVAKLLPLPRQLEAEGVRRYGFHGLSFTFLLQELGRVAGAEAAAGRVILAHLGAGASLAAVRAGKCIDTTMAFTPTAGLVMATRCGDIDPGLLVYLMRNRHMTADQVDDMVNRKSGLFGISETTPDMRDLLLRRAGDERAAEAVAIFCYQVKKWIGAFVAALGGLDTLVFSGGIGENAAEVRRLICESLECFGIQIDAPRNESNSAVISPDRSRATVRVIRTDEESVIVAAVQAFLQKR